MLRFRSTFCRGELSVYGFWAAIAIFWVALFTGALTASAQTITGAVRGIVTDPSGAVVKDASVVVKNIATGVSSTTVSDRNGLYNFPFLPIGAYTIRATAPGFDTASVGPFRLEIDQIASVNVKLVG